MGKIILFGDRSTPFTEKVARGLVLKKVDFELLVPQTPEELWEWDPTNGLIPVLQLGEERIPDSTRILERLDREFPEPPFLSEDPKVATAQRQLEDWADEVFLWYWRAWRAAVERRDADVLSGERIPSWLRPLARRVGGGSVARDPKAVTEELGRRLDDLVGFLGARPFFHADRPGMADLSVYAGLNAVRVGSWREAAQKLERRPTLEAFLQRIEEATGPRFVPPEE